MFQFDYQRPGSLAEAVALAAAEDAKILAGGQTLLPTMKQRLASPTALVDFSRLDELRGIEASGDTLSIGAMMRHAEVANSATIIGAIPGLAALAGMIGDPAVRNRGTIGGSLANNDPAADYPAACLALEATIVTNAGRYSAANYFAGLFETALQPGEVITKVLFPIGAVTAYQKFRNPASRYAIVGVFVARPADTVRVAVTGAGEKGVFRVPSFEAALERHFAPSALDGLSVSADDLISDIHADRDYRAHLIGVMAKRAVAAVR